MLVRRFKTGDAVKHRKGGPIMTVIKYATKKNSVLGVYLSMTEVVCGWFDPVTNERKTDVFHQGDLEKVDKPAELIHLIFQQAKSGGQNKNGSTRY